MKAWLGNRLGGSLVDPTQPQVSLLDHGLLLGDGLFETVLTRAGEAVFLSHHLARLERSASVLDLVLDAVALRDAVVELMRATESVADGRLRITVTSGVGPLGMTRGSEPTYFLLWEPLQVATEPARLTVSDVVRCEASALSGIKHTSWAENILAQSRAVAAGFSEALMLNTRGEVAETATSNIFMVKNRTVITPPLSSGCLAGITRALLVNNMPHDVRFAEMAFTLDELLAADEVFLTSSLRLVQPVALISDATFNVSGEITTRLAALMNTMAEANDD